MSEISKGYRPRVEVTAGDMAVDMGLRSYMLGIYGKVTLGLALAGSLAHATSGVPFIRDLLFRSATEDLPAGLTGWGLLMAMAPIVVLLNAGTALKKPTATNTGVLYWTLVSLIGVSMGLLVLTYTGAALATTFLVAATAFGALSLIGYATKTSLTGIGSFLIVGLVGLLATLGVGLLLHSPAIGFVANAAGVLIFAGLIAYDTQWLKLAYYQLGGDEAEMAVATNYGALSLFLDFINLFQVLLMLMSGTRR